MNRTELLELVIKASIEAGEKILKVYEEPIAVTTKSDDSPLTQADLQSNEVITNYLEKTPFPILSEEGKEMPYAERSNWTTNWIVDPLDGTKEFIKKNGEFTTNIALVTDGLPVLGVIYAPVLDELYFAEESFGAYKCSGKSFTGQLDDLLQKAHKLPLEQSSTKIKVVASRSHLSEETQAFIDELSQQHNDVETVSKGSSLKFCIVAEGSAQFYPRFAPTMEWDTAAGQAIVEMSGGTVIDHETGERMRYNRENLLNNWFLVKGQE